jgi:hypothetical protein
MMRVYISGKRTDLPAREIEEKFDAAECELAAQGFETVNPSRWPLPEYSCDKLKFMVDVLAIIGCDAVYMLSDWERCEVSLLEKSIADKAGKQIIYQGLPPLFVALKRAIGRISGVSFSHMAGDDRARPYVYARMIFAHHLRQNGASVGVIAAELNRNHSTVTYYLRKFNDEMRFNQAFRRMVERVNDELLPERADNV